MVVFNYSGKEVSAKVVYYGPGLSGKTTNLEWIYGKVPETQRGKMVSMKTKTDRTLFFDFLPLSAGEINGFRTRFLLYTVPGQVYYNATRKLVLKGADGIVFVADSDPQLRQANKESLANLEKNLNEYGTSIDQMPIVLQYNKRDLPQALPLEELNADLNPRGLLVVPAVAMRGEGVFETFKEITRLVFQKMHDRFEKVAPRSASVPPLPSNREAEPARASRGTPAPAPAQAATPGAAIARPAAATAAARGPIPPHASEDEVIHLSTIDQILAGRKPAPAAQAATAPVIAAAGALTIDATEPSAPVATAAPVAAVAAAAPPLPLPAEISLSAPRAAAPLAEISILAPIPTLTAAIPELLTAAPTVAPEIVLESTAAADQGVGVVEHRVCVPVVIPGPIRGRIRLVLEVDIREECGPGESEPSRSARNATTIPI